MKIEEAKPSCAPVNSIAEAIRGLAIDRSALHRALINTNRAWILFAEFEKETLRKIEALDRRIDELLALETKREFMRLGYVSIEPPAVPSTETAS